MKKMKAKILINPPPSDGCCECCGKHVSLLKEFGGRTFRKAKLVKSFRAEFRGTDNEQVGASWECKDCIKLDDEEYEKMKADTDFHKHIHR